MLDFTHYFPRLLAWCHFSVAVLNYDKCYSGAPLGCRLHFGKAIQHYYYYVIDNNFITITGFGEATSIYDDH